MSEKERLRLREATSAIDLVFTAPPGPENEFVEAEHNGRSVSIGEWFERPDGLWALRFDALSMFRALGKAEEVERLLNIAFVPGKES